MVPFLSFVTLTLAAIAIVVASVGSDVSRRKLGMGINPDLEKRDGVDCSDSGQSWFITTSRSEARTLATTAIGYLQDFGTNDSVFVAYFGAGLNNYTMQQNIFTNVANDNSLTLSCTDPAYICGNSGVDAYSLGSPNIYFCSIFYNQVPTSSLCSGTTVDYGSIRGATMIRQVTRALSDTSNGESGCSDARSLASSNPDFAIWNSGNYRCFAIQVYANTQC